MRLRRCGSASASTRRSADEVDAFAAYCADTDGCYFMALEEAARDLGASAWGAFRHVTLPLLTPGIAAGAMLAFALSFDDLVVTSFNTGVGSTTLPINIYSAIRFGVTPQINAISTIIVAVVSIALLVAWRLGAFRNAARAAVAEADAT